MSVDLPFSTPVFLQKKFELFERTSNLVRGGPVVQFAAPMWVAEYETPSFARQRIAEALDFVEAQQGGIGTFWAFDFQRPFPRNYVNSTWGALTRSGGGSFDGTALTIGAISANAITVTGMPSSFVFLKGDRVGLVKNSNRWLGRVTANTTGGGGGQVSALPVYPPIPTTIFDTASTFTCFRPRCVMRIDPGSVTSVDRGRFKSLMFRASQVFYA